ncbi:hypothetical protein [Actinomadura opuntiae]|nr:hypothetical protein [Actinomadura sp. OS1-43]MDL4813093.1 hypothetical protein [Actinomadura sp. OS1-43]
MARDTYQCAYKNGRWGWFLVIGCKTAATTQACGALASTTWKK